jgi:molybdopterin molybdotransferase
VIPVAQALEHLLALVAPLPAEEVDLIDAAGRVLAAPVGARRDQPPFPASAMDGYAVPADAVRPGATFAVIGTAAAGHPFDGSVGAGQAVRIFTGAPVPAGAGRVVIQEDATRAGDRITLGDRLDAETHIRAAGADFRAGAQVLPRRLGPADVALLAAMGHGSVPISRRPEVALLATGDELVLPGDQPGPGQITASNTYGLAALFRAAGARVRLMPIARDTEAALTSALRLAEGADLVVTIGGASVGDHDLVAGVTGALGMERSFYKVAMRPGKPLMAGRLAGAAMVGLPGNPVSAIVCGTIFILPMLDRLQGLAAGPRPRRRLPLAGALPQNGPREHYMRATVEAGAVTAADRQDSALLSVLAAANALLVRAPGDPAREPGEMVEVIDL